MSASTTSVTRGFEVLELDAQTLRDLEVFESSQPGVSLFDLCNHTRGKSGARALRTRMARPWSSPERIVSVQLSLQCILEHQAIFELLPTYVTAQIVDRYFSGTLPGLLGENFFDFGIGLIDLMLTDSRRYHMIVQGVGVTTTLIHGLRQVVFHEALTKIPDCELAALLNEMRELLSSPGLARITSKHASTLNNWSTLRCDQVYRLQEKTGITRLVQLMHEMDALISMAETTRIHHFVFPRIKTGDLEVQAESVVHPLVNHAVENPVSLDQTHRLLFLTGPNMAGKTTYLRAFATAVYFAHLGMGVPARAFSFVPAQKLFTSISLADNLHSGISFFRAEALRVKAIAQAVADDYRVIAVMDEPFKGTNVKDAFDASRVILERFASKAGNLFMFSSHLIELCDNLGSIAQVDCRFFEACEDEGKLRFEYRIRPGVSSQRLGMRVLKEEGIFELLDAQGKQLSG